MFFRWFAAVLLSSLIFVMASAPVMAEVKSSTDKIAGKFMELDLDESESVTFEEYKAMVDLRALTRFNEMDANTDGQITEEEYRKFWAENKARWYRLNR